MVTVQLFLVRLTNVVVGVLLFVNNQAIPTIAFLSQSDFFLMFSFQHKLFAIYWLSVFFRRIFADNLPCKSGVLFEYDVIESPSLLLPLRSVKGITGETTSPEKMEMSQFFFS